MGFLVKTKIKAYKKLTAVICCQIVARKSVASSSGDFRRRSAPRRACGPDEEYTKIKKIQKINTPVPRSQPDLRECVTSTIFKGYLFFLLGGLGREVPN